MCCGFGHRPDGALRPVWTSFSLFSVGSGGSTHHGCPLSVLPVLGQLPALSRGHLVPFCCVQPELGDPLPAWALAQSRNESFLPCLQPPYAVISYLTHRSFQFTFFLQNYGFSVLFLPLKELLGMTLPSNNPGRGLRCVNLRPAADQNAPWCLFTAHQFRHQLRSCSLLNVDKSPCIKFNLRFIRRDLKQERHLSRNWKKKTLLMMCY